MNDEWYEMVIKT